MKKSIIIYGNCQAQLYVDCLNNIPFFSDKFEVIWEPNADLAYWPARKELSELPIENCVFLMEQLGRKPNEFPHKELLPPDCVVTRFPYLKLNCLWPLLSHDPRNNPPTPPKFPAGRFPCGDKIVLSMLKNNIPNEDIFDEYMKTDITEHVDLSEVYQADLSRIKEVDDKCDIKVYDLIIAQFRSTRLFNSFSHPSKNIFKLLLLEILEKAGLIDKDLKDKGSNASESQTLNETIIDSVDKFFNVHNFDHEQVPVHPQVAKYFNLTWANSETRYLYFDFGYLTFSEYMQIYIDYAEPRLDGSGLLPNTIKKIKALLESEKFEEAEAFINQVIKRYPDSSELRNVYGELKLETGKIEDAKKIFSDISRTYPNNLEALNNLAVCLIFDGNWEAAVNILLEILEIDPSNDVARENLKFIKQEISLKTKN
jgi:tetratricopeptide (TPR) repeat protein